MKKINSNIKKFKKYPRI